MSTLSKIVQPFALARFKLRYAHAKLKKGTVRLKTRDMPRFYAQMNAADVPYVVLRWADDVPLTPLAEQNYAHDIDHLIGDKGIKTAMKIASAQPGKIKCDYYSATGRSGTSYKGMPYYMPVLSNQILASRVLDPRGFYRPNPLDEFHAFAYHMCYHKGHRSGISTGCKTKTDPNPSRDYDTAVLDYAKAAGVSEWQGGSLLDLHSYLLENGWALPYDLMTRWPDQHPFLKELTALTRAQMQSDIAALQDITLFVLRDDCDTVELERLAKDMISERFTILAEQRLDPLDQMRVMSQTRGGNWQEKFRADPVKPSLALICRNADKPGPLPVNMSASKLAAKYPHLTNTDVLIKRNIRAAVMDAALVTKKRVVIHATDNATEAAETLRAVFGVKTDAFLNALK